MRSRSAVSIWAPVILWAGVIFALSSICASDVHRLNIFHIPSEYLHRIGHFIEYAFLAALLVRALLYSDAGMSPIRIYVVAMVALILFAGADEWHQTFVPGRRGRASDVLYDILCVTIGIVSYYWYKRITDRQGDSI